MPEIQERRKNKQIPGARLLHEYANLYFDAHNPMLSRCRARNSEICVLRVDPVVLDTAGVTISTRNAASAWASFWPVADGLAMIERDRIFARYWKHPADPFEEMNHKSEKCAEVLVLDRVDARFVTSGYVANQAALATFQALETRLPVRSGMICSSEKLP